MHRLWLVALMGCASSDVDTDRGSPTADTDTAEPERRPFEGELVIIDDDGLIRDLCVTGDSVYALWGAREDPDQLIMNGASFEGSPPERLGASVSVTELAEDGFLGEAGLACTPTAAHVVWHEDAGEVASASLRGRQTPAGALALAPAALLAGGEGTSDSVGRPAIASTDEGLTLAWVTNSALRVATSGDGQAWTAPGELAVPGVRVGLRELYVHRHQQTVWLVWTMEDGGGTNRTFELFAARSTTAGQTFEDPLSLAGDLPYSIVSFCPDRTSPAVSVAWSGSASGPGVFVRSTVDGVSWASPPVRVDEPGGGPDAPDVACAARGERLDVAWVDDRTGLDEVYTRSVSAGQPVGDVVTVSQSTSVSQASFVTLAASGSANDEVLVVWLQSPTGPTLAALATPGRPFSDTVPQPLQVDGTALAIGRPLLSLDDGAAALFFRLDDLGMGIGRFDVDPLR